MPALNFPHPQPGWSPAAEFMTRVTGGVLAVGVQLYAAQQADRSSLLRDQTLVDNGMTHRVYELGHRPVALISWDEAVAWWRTLADKRRPRPPGVEERREGVR